MVWWESTNHVQWKHFKRKPKKDCFNFLHMIRSMITFCCNFLGQFFAIFFIIEERDNTHTKIGVMTKFAWIITYHLPGKVFPSILGQFLVFPPEWEVIKGDTLFNELGTNHNFFSETWTCLSAGDTTRGRFLVPMQSWLKDEDE